MKLRKRKVKIINVGTENFVEDAYFLTTNKVKTLQGETLYALVEPSSIKVDKLRSQEFFLRLNNESFLRNLKHEIISQSYKRQFLLNNDLYRDVTKELSDNGPLIVGGRTIEPEEIFQLQNRSIVFYHVDDIEILKREAVELINSDLSVELIKALKKEPKNRIDYILPLIALIGFILITFTALGGWDAILGWL